jgi:hypothetical protein
MAASGLWSIQNAAINRAAILTYRASLAKLKANCIQTRLLMYIKPLSIKVGGPGNANSLQSTVSVIALWSATIAPSIS